MTGLWVVRLLSPLPLASSAAMVFVHAAAVTEKCSRMPSLVNSLTVEGRNIDRDRQYVVEFIANSTAGFYVKGVRLTAFMVMKLSYLCGAVVFGISMQLVSEARE